ncbi:MAG: glycosyltransferase family 2 protein [Pseudomonadota bacterium]
MLSPSVSVVIPTCDRPQYLREAVVSVVAQTSPAQEIIVIDNGRQPVDIEMLPSYNNLRVVRALPYFGVSQARNLGVILATSQLVSFLDDDDAWDSAYLGSVRKSYQEKNAEVILGRLRYMNSKKPVTGKQAEFNDSNDLISKILRRNPGAGGSNTTVVRSFFMATAGYDPWITTNQDKALVLDLLLRGANSARADEGWVDFRDDGDGPRQTALAKRAKGKLRFLRKYWRKMSWSTRFFNLATLVLISMQRMRGVLR